jgi:hypothetical protein
MKSLTQKETNDILGFFRKQTEDDGKLDMDEIEEYQGSINLMDPLHIKEFFSNPNNSNYYDKYWKSIVNKAEGDTKPSSKPKYKKVKIAIEEIPSSPPPPPPAKMTLKERQQSMKEKLKKLDENVPEIRTVVQQPSPPPARITSPNGFGAFETYLLLRIQPDKDNEANNLIKMLESSFIERGFTESAVKDIKKILKLAKYRDLVITSAIQERINNPVVAPSPVVTESVAPQPKKRGRPPKKKILEGSNNLILIDNIIKKNKEVSKMLKDYFDYIYEEGSAQ